MGLPVRELHTGQEVLENVRVTRAYFSQLRPALKSPWQTRFEQASVEIAAIKQERDQYRALYEELRQKQVEQIQIEQLKRMEASKGRVTINQVLFAVCEFYGVPQCELVAERRMLSIVIPRHVAMYLCRELTLNSLPTIGRRFGGRDHTTVMHAVRKIEKLRQAKPEIDEQIKTLSSKLLLAVG